MMKQEGRSGSVMYKSQLQEYAQKAAILPPVYEFVKEGASHEPRFKAIVILNNVTYESPPGFPNLRSAEHAAAKAALDGLLQSTGEKGVHPSPVHESGLCKNLLQEYAQKNSLPLPVYQSKRSGEDHAPTFTSSVEIAGVKYSGGSAKNKKEAEIKAARTALLAIQTTKSSFAGPDSHFIATSEVQPQVGLATHITSHLNSTPGKKRGRGAALTIIEEPSAGKQKTTQVLQSMPRVTAKALAPLQARKATETRINPIFATQPKVHMMQVSPLSKASVDIIDLLATSSAKKILGVTPKLPKTESPCLLQESELVASSPTHTDVPSSESTVVSKKLDTELKNVGKMDGVAEQILPVQQTIMDGAQFQLSNGGSEPKEANLIVNPLAFLNCDIQCDMT